MREGVLPSVAHPLSSLAKLTEKALIWDGFFCWGFDEQVCLFVCVLDALAGNIKIFWLHLDANEAQSHLNASNTCCAGAHERVQYCLSFRW